MDRRITLRGRDAECAVLHRLLGAARSGQSGALVVRGEPGIGKTALLEYAVASAPGLRLLRATGVQSEIELAFAGLHQLCAPMLDRLDRLPDPQRQALRVAFGMSVGEAPDRFVVIWRRSACYRMRPTSSRFYARSTTPSGWTRSPRLRWRSWRAGCSRSRSQTCL